MAACTCGSGRTAAGRGQGLPVQRRAPAPALRRRPRLSVRASAAASPQANGSSGNGNGAASQPGVARAVQASAASLSSLDAALQQAAQQAHQPFVGLPGNTYDKIQDCVSFVRARSLLVPEIVVVLGSGLGAIADEMDDAVSIPYAEIPHFHAPGVEGHPGRVVLGRMQGVPALVLQGRFHYYEGHPMDEVILPIRMAKYLGCHSAVITNAAGGLNPAFLPGDLMLIEDHINMIGSNPLRGPNPKELGGPRFLDLTAPYDAEYCAILEAAAGELRIPPLRRGVYVGVSGPTYETRAEIRMFRAMGADAVGMSTVPEVIAARHLGVRVAALSCITNLACGLGEGKLSHEDVMEQGALAADKMRRLLVAAVPRIAAAAKAGVAA